MNDNHIVALHQSRQSVWYNLYFQRNDRPVSWLGLAPLDLIRKCVCLAPFYLSPEEIDKLCATGSVVTSRPERGIRLRVYYTMTITPSGESYDTHN